MVAVVAAVEQVQGRCGQVLALAVAAARLRLVAHPPGTAPHAEPAVVVVDVAAVALSNPLFCIV